MDEYQAGEQAIELLSFKEIKGSEDEIYLF